MYFPALYTDPKTGIIDLDLKESLEKISRQHHRHNIRSRKRIKMVTDRFKTIKYFDSMVSIDKEKYKDVPVVLYETDNGSYNVLDYMINYLKEFKNKTYDYNDHKTIVSDFVEAFDIKVQELPDNQIKLLEDLDGNFYRYDLLWYHLCKFVLRENG